MTKAMWSNVKESKVTEKKVQISTTSYLELIPKLPTSGNHYYLFKITILRNTVKDINKFRSFKSYCFFTAN